MIRLILTFFIFLFVVVPVHAADDEANWIVVNIHDELVECSAFYGFVKAIVQNSGDKEAANKIKPVTKHLSKMITAMGKVGGITTESSLALYQLFLEKYENRIGGNANNLPVLVLEYKDICKQVVDDPDSRFDFYQNEYKKKFEK